MHTFWFKKGPDSHIRGQIRDRITHSGHIEGTDSHILAPQRSERSVSGGSDSHILGHKKGPDSHILVQRRARFTHSGYKKGQIHPFWITEEGHIDTFLV